MLVDGRAIAAEILAEVEERIAARPQGAPRLAAITCAPNFETAKYLEMKKRRAASVGIVLNVIELPETVTTSDVTDCIMRVSEEANGIVVQLPLPAHIDREAVLASVSARLDPDGFHYGSSDGACLPPVVGAIDEISARHNVEWEERNVVILGAGRLVGAPAAVYARRRGASVTVLNETSFTEAVLKDADIIVSGVGRPNLITPEMLKPGVVVFDAGTSEEGGVLVGDAHPEVSAVASLLTPVPGGIGPVTIALLLRNLLHLARQ